MCFHSTPFYCSYKFLQALPGLVLVIKLFGICIYLDLAFIKRHHKVPDCAITHLIPPEGGPKASLGILDWPAGFSSFPAGHLRGNKTFPSWFILSLVVWVCEKMQIVVASKAQWWIQSWCLECEDQRDPRRALNGCVLRALSLFFKSKISAAIHLNKTYLSFWKRGEALWESALHMCGFAHK